MIAGYFVYVRNQFGGYDPEKRPRDMPHVAHHCCRVRAAARELEKRCPAPKPQGQRPEGVNPEHGNNAFEGSEIPAKSWIFAKGVIAKTRGSRRCGFFSSYSLEVLGSQQQPFPDTLRKRNARQHARRSIGSLI
jgi:hypothetical protein